ncbi:MAG: hypothetical protein WA194_03810 [Patescibacteria group bacterium]
MNAKVSPAPSAESAPIATAGSAKSGQDALSLDFTRRSVADLLAQAAAKEAAEVPEILDYQKWDAWYEGFVEEIASLP